MTKNEYKTTSLEQTHTLGRKIAVQLQQGDVVALCGDLGSGKTSLTQGIAFGLGVPPDTAVNSPTFTLVNEYSGDVPVFHLDLYRISSVDEFYLSGLDECFSNSAVTIIEWADKLRTVIPEKAVWISMEFINESTRKITLNGDR